MSHRRKQNIEKRTELAKSKPVKGQINKSGWRVERDTTINLEEIDGLIDTFLSNSEENFQCMRCGGLSYEMEEDEYGATNFICSSCGWKLEIITPFFLGETHDQIIGYAITEITGNPEEPLKMHYLGAQPN